jgi:hypothetical protein
MPTDLPDPRKRKSGEEEWYQQLDRLGPIALRAALVTAAAILAWSYFSGG